MYIPGFLKTSQRETHFSACLLNTRVNTFSGGRYLPKVPHATFADVLRNRRSLKFCEIHGKKPVAESLFIKVIDLYPAILLKEKDPIQVFSDEFCEIFKAPVLQNTSRRLRLFYGKIFASSVFC